MTVYAVYAVSSLDTGVSLRPRPKARPSGRTRRFAPPGRVITASSSAMAHLGMSDDEMTTFIKDGFGVDSSLLREGLVRGGRAAILVVRAHRPGAVQIGWAAAAERAAQGDRGEGGAGQQTQGRRGAAGTANGRPGPGRWFMEAASSMACAAIPAAHRHTHTSWAK